MQITSIPTVATPPLHHPPEEILIDYASGAVSEAEALMIAVHLEMCGACRTVFHESIVIGGALLETLAPAPLPPALLNRTLAALDALPVEKPRPALKPILPAFGSRWPAPLRAYIEQNRLKNWRWLPAGFRALQIPFSDLSSRVWLMRAPGGRGPLHHSHTSDEWTVVLEGGFSDETGVYGAGDFCYIGPGEAHHPVAEEGEGCVCLILARDKPRYSTLAGRVLAPFIQL